MYSNDRKAPRMRKKEFTQHIINKELWQNFIKSYPEYNNMTYNEFKSHWDDIAETIRIETVTNPLGVKLGSYSGELKLQYLPNKFTAINMKLSQDMGEAIPNLNLINRGKVARIKWERRWAVKFNKILQFFAFEPTRKINEMAEKYIKANPEKLRVARNTLGGHSIWRQLIRKEK